jgi:tRNA-(ms[2]io[6]A)-hydroxylase
MRSTHQNQYFCDMLGLKLATDPVWVNLAEKALEEILTDHAYCEQKAASSCIALIQLYPEKQFMVDKLAPVVSEEWSHFRMVLAEFKKRDLRLGKQRRDEYANQLKAFAQKGGSAEGRFLDRLLLAAMIEARSCERFRLLSLEINDRELRQFYHGLMVAEANHYRLFIDIAEHYFDKSKVRRRWTEWLDKEAAIIQSNAIRGDRMH